MLLYRPRFRHPEKAAKPTNLAAAQELSPILNFVSADPVDLAVDVETPTGEVLAIDDPLLARQLAELRIDLVRRCRLARVRALVDRHQAQQPHQALDPFAIDDMALSRQPRRHPARAIVGPGQIVPIEQRHNRKILRADLGRLSVDCRARHRQQPALPGYRQHRVHALDHRASCRPAHLPSFRAKKSFSTFSWPICRYRTSTRASLAASSAVAPLPSKTLAAPSSSCFFQL
jgi:hypothetical protein